ncbi:MAG: glycine zipper family protein [Bacteroidetes bacterium]|nr:glycine zipper family protein [Bacteroidota bacterium]
MKLITFLLLVLSLNKCFGQGDTIVFNTGKIFSIAYLDRDKNGISLTEYSSYNSVFIDTLSKNFLTIERKYNDLNNPLRNTKVEKIPLRNIKSLGYVVGNHGPIGALIGAGSGAVAGFIITALSINSNTGENNDKTNPKGIGIVSGLFFGTFLGFWIGVNNERYEDFDLMKYNNDIGKKYNEIIKIIQTGIKHYKLD